MLSNWTSAHKSVLICVDRLLQCCASLECSSPPVSYSITKPQHWHNDVNVFTDSEVEWKQALPAILIGKWFWELLKFKKIWNGKPLKASMILLLMRLLEDLRQGFFFLLLKFSMPRWKQKCVYVLCPPKETSHLFCSCLACGVTR